MGTINSIGVNPLNDLIGLIWFKKNESYKARMGSKNVAALHSMQAKLKKDIVKDLIKKPHRLLYAKTSLTHASASALVSKTW